MMKEVARRVTVTGGVLAVLCVPGLSAFGDDRSHFSEEEQVMLPALSIPDGDLQDFSPVDGSTVETSGEEELCRACTDGSTEHDQTDRE